MGSSSHGWTRALRAKHGPAVSARTAVYSIRCIVPPSTPPPASSLQLVIHVLDLGLSLLEAAAIEFKINFNCSPLSA
jgi:hypothetical protein